MGTEYNNQILLQLLTLLKMAKPTSVPCHHQTVGTLERSNCAFNEYMRSYIHAFGNDWNEWIKYFTYTFNTTPSTVHGYFPFELIFASALNNKPLLTPYDKMDAIYNFDDYMKKIKFRLQTALNRAKRLNNKTKIY